MLSSVATVEFVSRTAYDALMIENLQLKQTIATLNANSEVLRRLNEEQARTIEELKAENRALREEMKVLQEKVDRQGVELKIQDAKLQAQAAQIKALEVREQFATIQYAVQDVNRADTLEGPFPYLRRFRNARTATAHYILDSDSQDIQDYKRRLLYYTLIKAQTEPLMVAKLRRYPTLLVDLLGHLAAWACVDGSALTDIERESAEEWWD